MPDPRHLIPVSQIVDMLNERLEAVVERLGLRGERWGPELFVKNPNRDDRSLGSMAIRLDGTKRGTWADFATTGSGGRKHDSGDVLDLIAYVECGGDVKRAVGWAKSWLGLDDLDPARLKRTARQARVAKSRQRKEAEAEQRKFRASAWRRWEEAEPDILGTPVERYLRGRSIDVRALPRVPRALRYHPALTCRELGKDVRLPAMVGIIQGADGRFLAIHRTWLRDLGGGRWGKAELKETKKTLGLYEGGFIRLHRGESGKRLAAAPDCDMVMVAEGIEDALTAAQARPDFRAIAAVSVANMANITLPASIGTVMVIADNDEEGSAADGSLGRAFLNFAEQGFDVLEARPPRGVAKDLNELACKGVA